MGECEICHSCPAEVTAIVTPPDGTLEVCRGCMDSTGASEGWKDADTVAAEDAYTRDREIERERLY